MRIVLISTDREPTPPTFGGAIGILVYELAKELSKKGHEVHLIGVPNYQIDYESEGVVFHPLCPPKHRAAIEKMLGENSSLFTSSLQVSMHLSKLEGEVDVMQAYYFTTWVAPIFHKAKLRIQQWVNTPKENLVNRIIARKYDLVCGDSRYIVRRLVRDLGVNPSKTTVIPDHVNPEFFKPDASLRESYRKKFGIGSNVLILYVGRIVPEKGVHHLVEVLRKLASANRSVRLAIVGPKGHFHKEEILYFSYLKRKIKDYDLQDNILWLGKIPRNRMPGVYNAADIVAIPTLMREGGPLVSNLEALSSGRAVVAYGSGAIPEVITHMERGVLVEEGDVEGFAKSIQLLLEDPGLRKKMGKKARKYILEHHSLSKVATIIGELYNDALATIET